VCGEIGYDIKAIFFPKNPLEQGIREI